MGTATDIVKSNASANLLILGKEGSGKSSLGNALMGEATFAVSSGMCSATTSFKLACSPVPDGESQINIVDSPDLTSEASGSSDEKIRTIRTSLAEAFKLCPKEECHLIVLTCRLDVRLTDEHRLTLSSLADALGTEVLSRVGVVVFTHGDCIENDEGKFHEIVSKLRSDNATPIIGSLIEKCNGRYDMIDASRGCDPSVQRSQVLRLMQFAKTTRPVRHSDICAGVPSVGSTSGILVIIGLALATYFVVSHGYGMLECSLMFQQLINSALGSAVDGVTGWFWPVPRNEANEAEL